ncbi:DUF2140 family protein [Phocicoccus pinnipedialis]|uniref:DUF2140 family protein n=1 Tax=Phocicoccus pinnipedialis TaxID=110845 RepID=A0A6V7RDG4_9BACL|nr:DUF2140 family protein [Jeotgalicoccus pinnipedialis]MBP1939403.1 uncharacterized protein YpmS [Jeotgalicoccus pinnipedialis]CAD2075510.1 hypothetical protein JEOPIN946_01037 [Jeotgalicoccus pinnipedialis]
MNLKNKWKFLFLSLLAVNILMILSIFIAILFSPKFDEEIPEITSSQTEIQVITNNQMIERIINQYIDTDDLSIKIDESGVLLNTKYPVLGKDIDIDIQVEPLVHKDKIILNLAKVEIMNLPINVDYIYAFMKRYILLEEGLSYSENSKAIIVDSSIFTKEMDMDVTINNIDYKKDAWYFSINNLFKD